MKKTMAMVLFLAMVGVAPAGADLIEDEKNSSEARTPHHDLREAVAKIRSQYSPEYRAFADYQLASAGRNVRLGILLAPGTWIPDEDGETGAVITAVTPGSPADEAGLLAGDVITHFNGEALVDDDDLGKIAWMQASQRLVELARELEEGDEVSLEYRRDGTTHSTELVARELQIAPMTLEQLRTPFEGYVRAAAPFIHAKPAQWFLPRAWLDMELVALNPELGEYFGADSGVLVVRGPTEDDTLGLKSGDVILRVGDREVRSPEHAMRILRSYEPEEELTLHIVRHQRSQTLTGSVPESPVDFNFGFDFKERWKPADR